MHSVAINSDLLSLAQHVKNKRVRQLLAHCNSRFHCAQFWL